MRGVLSGRDARPSSGKTSGHAASGVDRIRMARIEIGDAGDML
jgi:hypothetical protein